MGPSSFSSLRTKFQGETLKEVLFRNFEEGSNFPRVVQRLRKHLTAFRTGGYYSGFLGLEFSSDVTVDDSMLIKEEF